MGRRGSAAAVTLVFLALAPGTVGVLIPWWLSGWRVEEPFLDWAPIRWIGGLLIPAGLGVVLESFARFAWHGRGTPTPVYPTERLVGTGLYRHVRNPMYVGVVALVLGQALLFGQTDLLVYAGVLWLGFHIFVLLYEEPTLKARYGPEYDAFRKAVPRWIPRLRPWRDGSTD